MCYNLWKCFAMPGVAEVRQIKKLLLNIMPTVFQQKVFSVVRNIPKGQTLTYQKVADLIGRPTAARAVGNALNKNFDPAVPCHRVIRSDGKTGGYNRGPENKLKILIKEKALQS